MEMNSIEFCVGKLCERKQFPQLTMQDTKGHGGIFTETAKNLLGLLASMVALPWDGEHACATDAEGECPFCDECLRWHRTVSEIVTHIAPKEAVGLPENDLPVLHPISGEQTSCCCISIGS